MPLVEAPKRVWPALLLVLLLALAPTTGHAEPNLVPLISKLLLRDHGPTGVLVHGTGESHYWAWDARGEHVVASASTGQLLRLDPGVYMLRLNDSKLRVRVVDQEVLEIDSGRVVVKGLGQDLYQIYDATNTCIRTKEPTNTVVELFPRSYTLRLNGESLAVDIVPRTLTMVEAGSLQLKGTGNDLYQVYDRSDTKIRTNAYTNTVIELFASTYSVRLHNISRVTSITAGERTSLQAGRLTVDGGRDLYRIESMGKVVSTVYADQELELWPQYYQVSRIPSGASTPVMVQRGQLTTVVKSTED
jgi:hypothetical protein